MTLNLTEEVEVPFDFDYTKVAENVISAVVEHENFPYPVEVDLTIVDDAAIMEMNQEYRSIDRSTDVLSFPMHEYPAPGDFSELDQEPDLFDPDTEEVLLGDIVLSVDHILKQAEEYGHSVLREYAFLICHSMLHLLGYDHMEEDERIQMEQLQDEILDTINIRRN